jgi:hypothetical protein
MTDFSLIGAKTTRFQFPPIQRHGTANRARLQGCAASPSADSVGATSCYLMRIKAGTATKADIDHGAPTTAPPVGQDSRPRARATTDGWRLPTASGRLGGWRGSAPRLKGGLELIPRNNSQCCRMDTTSAANPL